MTLRKLAQALCYGCTIAAFGLAAWATIGFNDVVMTTFASLGGCCALILARIDQL
jgi:hypothetical protein